jgi:hypothetical protein
VVRTPEAMEIWNSRKGAGLPHSQSYGHAASEIPHRRKPEKSGTGAVEKRVLPPPAKSKTHNGCDGPIASGRSGSVHSAVASTGGPKSVLR